MRILHRFVHACAQKKSVDMAAEQAYGNAPLYSSTSGNSMHVESAEQEKGMQRRLTVLVCLAGQE
jgi:hypothetical protein